MRFDVGFTSTISEGKSPGAWLTFFIGFIPFLGYHHVLMILIGVAIVLLCKSFVYPFPRKTSNIPRLALLLAGCSSSSPLIPGIFLLSFFYKQYVPVASTAQVDFGVHTALTNIVGNAELEVRVGYFGICISLSGGGWICGNNATALADTLSVDEDPLNTLWVASQIKDNVVFPYLMSILYLLIPQRLTNPTQHHRPNICLYLLPSARHLPRLARRSRLRRLRTRSETLPLARSLASRPIPRLHRLHVRLGLGIMATHSLSSGQRRRPRLQQRKRQKWRRHRSHDPRVDQLHPFYDCYDWTVGYDSEH